MQNQEAYQAFLSLNKELSTREILNALGAAGHDVSLRTVQRWLKDLNEPRPAPTGMVQASPVVNGVYNNQHADLVQVPDGVYVITAAQADTYINEDFFASLLLYCQHRSATLMIAPMVYNARRTSKLWFDHRISEYLVQGPIKLAPDLVVACGINVLPSAARPLSGFASYFREGSGIIPHTKMQLDSLPRYKGTEPRFLYSTGCITRRNYTQSKSGAIADFHHVFGALVVEVKEGTWFVRQLVADEHGEFFDLTTHATPYGVEHGVAATVITWGDLHCEELSEMMLNTMLNIQKTLNPSVVICHDVLDFSLRSYHNKSNYPYLAKLRKENRESVSSALECVAGILNELSLETDKLLVVPSNHDKHLERWLDEPHDQTDFSNSCTYHYLNYRKYQAICNSEEYRVLEDALGTHGLFSGITILQEDESYELNGIEYSLHGDSGPNGSRGSPNNLRGIGVKLNTGHTHSASIVDGVYTGGCMCSLDLGYNTGPSSWSNSFILTYKNGKRSIVTIRDETEWRIE